MQQVGVLPTTNREVGFGTAVASGNSRHTQERVCGDVHKICFIHTDACTLTREIQFVAVLSWTGSPGLCGPGRCGTSCANSPIHRSEWEILIGWRRRALDDLGREHARHEMLRRIGRVLTLRLWRE